MAKKPEYYCPRHPLTPLVCPQCLGAEGGKKTAKKHPKENRARWGKLGGRPQKKKKR